jgi:hypothetical protein
MDGRELRKAILREESGGGSPYEVRYTMTAMVRCTSGAAGPILQRIMICIRVFFMLFNYHCGTSKFDVKIFDGTQCQKKYEAEVHFH